MARSFDTRHSPAGPEYAPGKRALRGAKRVGPIGAILPGDDLEVAREIARLQDGLASLRRHANASGGGGASGFIALWFGASFPLGVGPSGGVWRVPYLEGASVTVTFTRAFFRVETPGSSGTYTAVIEKSNGGGAFTATAVATMNLVAADREDEDVTGLGTATSGQLLRVNFTALGIGASTYTVQLEGDL